jgi:hypothetical protein
VIDELEESVGQSWLAMLHRWRRKQSMRQARTANYRQKKGED